MTTTEAAQVLSVSESFLAKARMAGNGPRYRKLGRAVRYQHEDLVAWSMSRAKTSTAQ